MESHFNQALSIYVTSHRYVAPRFCGMSQSSPFYQQPFHFTCSDNPFKILNNYHLSAVFPFWHDFC